MKLKVGMAVEVNEGISVISDIDTISTIPDIYFIKGFGWYNDWQFVPLPNHFINNPGKAIMKARIRTDSATHGKCYWECYGHGSYVRSTKTYGIIPMYRTPDNTIRARNKLNAPDYARQALKLWAKAHGVNVEIVEGSK